MYNNYFYIFSSHTRSNYRELIIIRKVENSRRQSSLKSTKKIIPVRKSHLLGTYAYMDLITKL